MLELLFKIGFLDITFWDILDIILVALLLFNLYRLLKGSLAFNIFIGLLLVYLVWLLVRALNMQLLAGILGQFINVGVIALLIVFQPEVRRFLLFLGKSSFIRSDTVWKRLLSKPLITQEDTNKQMEQLLIALNHLKAKHAGSILVFPKTSQLQFFANTGVPIGAVITANLLESIFEKNSPLHDGAVIISQNKIVAAKCILPVSDNPDLPSQIGTRHRAAVGITEHSDAIAILVSEERGQISYARGGRITMNITELELKRVLKMAMAEDAN